MAYKITKYRGEHKIKDTKTGKSVGIDIERYMNGGGKKKKKDLSGEQVQDIRDTTGVQFTAEGANSLFETISPAVAPEIPDFDLGRYKDVGYFNVNYANNEFNVAPTKNNPGNYAKYKEYLNYLQEKNPDAKINRKGYLPVGKRLEYGGEMYTNGGGKKKKKDLSGEQVQDIRDTTGVQFTNEGANSLFETISPAVAPETPDFDLGRYKDVGYFNVNYANDQFNVSPTKRNPGNYSKYKEYLDYLQEKNPDVKVNRTQNADGYVPFGKRLEYGGKITSYQVGGTGLVDEEQLALEEAQEMGLFADSLNQGDTEFARTKGVDLSQTTGLATADVNNSLEGRRDKDIDYNIPNPYAGVDIPGAANYLGQSIENKNTFGIVASGLKVATGLARNVVSGMGTQNRYNQVMEDYYQKQKDNKNPIQYQQDGGELETFAYGGKKDEELATGEYMHGVMNPDTENFNAEIEKGEYFQSNEGDVAEVVGDKHTNGGEKIQMEPEDRVLSDKLKLGAKTAKTLSEKYGLKLKAKDTYSTVLDKFRKKSKLSSILDEEAEVLKKIGEQDKVEDAATKGFNLDVLTKKKAEIAKRKHPIEEERKSMFDELYNIQEESKPKSKENKSKFEFGGDLKALAKEYNIPLDKAKELIQNFQDGGKKKKGSALGGVPEGQSLTEDGLYGTVTPEQYEKFVKRNSQWFNFEGFDPSKKQDVERLQERYNELTGGNKVQVDGKFGEQTASLLLTPPGPSKPVAGVDNEIVAPLPGRVYSAPPKYPEVKEEDMVVPSEGALAGAYLFPDETPLPPSSLQGTIKPERRFDRVRPTEIDAEPYLQDTRDREEAQVQSLEGLSSNVRAAVLANMRANSQGQESEIRNKIDTANLASEEKAIYTNAQIQAREENASAADRLAYEQRQYRAQALTDNDLNNYYNQLQSINKQRFMDIHNLNLINATNEDVYFDGQKYRRKNSDQEIISRINV